MISIKQHLKKLKQLKSYWTAWLTDQAVIGRDGFLRKEKRWYLVTTFKDNWALMEAYLNYYMSIWKIDTFVLMMGYTNETSKQRILDRLGSFCGANVEPSEKIDCEMLPQVFENVVQYRFVCTEISIRLVCYQTTISTPVLVFDQKIRPKLHFIAGKLVSSAYNRVLEIDNDEYLYAKNLNRVKRRSEHLFYFLDYIPSNKFHPKADMYWSLQGMLHRKGEPYLETRKIIHTSKVIRFLRLPGQSRHVHWHSLQRSLGSLLFFLPIRDICSLTERLVKAERLSEARHRLMISGVCFHCPVLDLESIRYEKGIQYDQTESGYSIDNFQRYATYRSDIPNIKDNFIRDWLHPEYEVGAQGDELHKYR